jgi:hypothetical protein
VARRRSRVHIKLKGGEDSAEEDDNGEGGSRCGKFVKPGEAVRRPKTTVTETVKRPKKR